MGCTFSGFNLLYDAVNGGGDVWINERRFKIIRQLGEGGFAYVYLVKEQSGLSPGKRPKDTSHLSEDGIYALKKVLTQTDEQLQSVKQEIHVSSLFSHPNLLPLLDHSIIAVKGPQEGTWNQEAYLLFPAYLNGTLLDNAQSMKAKNEYYPPGIVLHMFKQEWAAEHCSAPYRAPELWDCPSNSDIDERTDIWSLGCTLYAIMYGVSPFEYALGDSGGSLQLAAMSGQVKWPPGPNPSYPDSLRQFVTWMLQPQAAIRPHIDDVIIHVDKLLAKFPS